MASVDLLGVEVERVLAPSILAFESAIDICRSTASACVHLPPWRSSNEHFFRDLTLCVWAPRRAAHWRSRIFFFFFYCRSHNETGPNPLPPIWKFFRLSATCELLRWPLRSLLWRNSKCVIDGAQPLSFHLISGCYAHPTGHLHGRTLQKLDLFDSCLGWACSFHAGVCRCIMFTVELSAGGLCFFVSADWCWQRWRTWYSAGGNIHSKKRPGVAYSSSNVL